VAASDEPLSTEEKIYQLASELGAFHDNPDGFQSCNTMPKIMYQHLKELLLSGHKKFFGTN
jgi:hypothetical protein